MILKKIVIDLGTNSVLYLLTGCDETGMILTLSQNTHFVRLGKNSHKTGMIQKDRLKEVVKILNNYKKEALRQNVHEITVFGTQVFRSAENSRECCRIIFEQTGLNVEILSEEDESRWGYMGAMYCRNFDDLVCTCDIGGGSCEVVLGKNNEILGWESIPLGAVNLTEKCVRHDPPSLSEYQDLEKTISSALPNQARDLLEKGIHLVVSGGTITTLAAYDLQLSTYDPKLVDGYCLTRNKVEDIINRLMISSLTERQEMLVLDPERADILFAGAVFLKKIMDLGNFDSLVVSDRGVRFGVAVREWRKTVK